MFMKLRNTVIVDGRESHYDEISSEASPDATPRPAVGSPVVETLAAVS